MAGGGGVDAQRDRLRLAGAAQDGTATRQQEGRRRRRVSARKHAASETAPGADVCRQQHAGAAREPAAQGLAGAAWDEKSTGRQEGPRRRSVSPGERAGIPLKTAAGADVFRLQLAGAARDPAA